MHSKTFLKIHMTRKGHLVYLRYYIPNIIGKLFSISYSVVVASNTSAPVAEMSPHRNCQRRNIRTWNQERRQIKQIQKHFIAITEI